MGLAVAEADMFRYFLLDVTRFVVSASCRRLIVDHGVKRYILPGMLSTFEQPVVTGNRVYDLNFKDMPEPGNRFLQAVFQLHFRFPVKFRRGDRDVGTTLDGIILGQWLEFQR